MADLFTDGFEGGDYGNWSSSSATGSGTSIAVSHPAALTGTFGSRATHNYTTADQNYEAKISKTVSPPVTAVMVASTKIRLTTVTAVGYGAMGSKAVLVVKAQDGQEQAWFSIRSGGLRFSYRAKNGSVVSINSNVPLTVGTVAYLRIMVDRAGLSPLIEGWISTNGTDWSSVGSASDVSSGSQGVGKISGQIEAGIVHISNFETGNYVIDHDEIRVADALGVVDWRVISNLTQPLRFAADSVVSRTGTTNLAMRLSTALQGRKTAVALSEQVFRVSPAFSASREALAPSSSTFHLTEATNPSVDRRSTSRTVLPLEFEPVGEKDWRSHSDAEFALITRLDAVDGEIKPAAVVRVSTRAWGSVSVMDTEG